MVLIPCDNVGQFTAELLEIKRNVFQQSRLISFQANHIVRLTILDFWDDALLTAHGICGYDASRYVQCIQKVWNCRDLIGFFLCHQFPDCHLVFRCKRTHNMMCLVDFALDAPYSFSIYGYYCAPFPVTAQPVVQIF